MGIKFERSTFLPAEAAQITGVNVAQQRNLRRHGYIPEESSGWMRFTLEELARLLVIGKLTTLGVRPGFSSIVADHLSSTAVALLAHAADVAGAAADPLGLNAQNEPAIKHSRKLHRYFTVTGPTNKEVAFSSVVPEASAYIVIDLRVLAAEMVKASPKPLWTVVKA